MKRDECIERIKTALKNRSTNRWSVRGGRKGASDWGWIRVEPIPSRMVPGRGMTEEDMKELMGLFGVDKSRVSYDGLSIPHDQDFWQEYVDRAEGKEPSVIGVPNWDY